MPIPLNILRNLAHHERWKNSRCSNKNILLQDIIIISLCIVWTCYTVTITEMKWWKKKPFTRWKQLNSNFRSQNSCKTPLQTLFLIGFTLGKTTRSWMSLGKDNRIIVVSYQSTSRQEIYSSTHLDKRSKQRHMSSNSRFDLHSPKVFNHYFRKQHGHVLCSHFTYCLSRRVYTRVLTG